MSNFNQAQAISKELEANQTEERNLDDDSDLLQLARDNFRSSTDYFESSIKKQLERNVSHFRSKHAPGSKYYSDAYRYRSKIFRPKMRAAVRKHEAAAAAAYFSTNDAVHITAEDQANPEQVMSAEINSEVMNYRLDHSIPWFKMIIGAYQEAMVIGSVVSYQSWSFKEKTVKIPTGQEIYNDETEEYEQEYREESYIIEDKPVIELRPIENIRFDPAANWDDPINTSPYLIDMIPMYVEDIREKMKNKDPKTGQPEWRHLTDGQIMSGSKQNYDSLRQERQGSDRRDPEDSNDNIYDYQIIWVHRNFVRINGEHVMYYTLGTEFVLSDAKPIEDVYRRKTRPYVMGVSQIEAHRTNPTAMVELGEQIQNECNEIANARIDNLKLAINQRHYIRRGADIDFTALMRSAPGSGIMVDDVLNDIKPEKVQDVTSSSYAEQERLDGDFNDIIGGFSAGSASNNKNTNAMTNTLGGTEILSGDANKMEEYQLRVFNETWAEPVLNQILDMIKEFETDENIIAIAGQNSPTAKKLGVKEFNWRMLQAPMTLKVAVGFGATNPQKRIEKISVALRSVGEFMPNLIADLDQKEVANEIFGAVGSDAGRFFKSLRNDEEAPDPQIQAMQQQIQELQQIIEGKQVEQQGKMEIEKIKQDGKLQIEKIKTDLALIDKQLDAEKNELARAELMLEQSALIHSQKVIEIQLLRDERSDVREEIEKVSASIEQTGMDDSKAGLIQRDDYGQAPFMEG